MKEKSGDRQSCGGKLLEGLEQAGDRSDLHFRNYIGQLWGMGITWAQFALALSLELSLALSATSVAWPRKPL